MINFEEELKKFGPSMEIEEVENAVRDHELTDMTDIMFAMMRQQAEAPGQGLPAAAPVMQTVQPMGAAQPVTPQVTVTPAQ